MSSSSAQLRKIKKPLIERRRRERINDSLNQLKNLVLEATNKDETRYSKMEKADILEMTVAYLRAIHCRRRSGVFGTTGTDRYAAGFRECAVHVGQFLVDAGMGFGAVHDQLLSHLEKAMQAGVDMGTCARITDSDNVDVEDAAIWSGDCDETGRTSPDTDDDNAVSGIIVDNDMAAVDALKEASTMKCYQAFRTNSATDSPRNADEFPSQRSYLASNTCSPAVELSLGDVLDSDLLVSSGDVIDSNSTAYSGLQASCVVNSASITADCVWRPWR